MIWTADSRKILLFKKQYLSRISCSNLKYINLSCQPACNSCSHLRKFSCTQTVAWQDCKEMNKIYYGRFQELIPRGTCKKFQKWLDYQNQRFESQSCIWRLEQQLNYTKQGESNHFAILAIVYVNTWRISCFKTCK